MSSPTRIGFVDHDLNNFHANVYVDIFRDQLKDRGYVVAGCTARRKTAGRSWAEEKGVPWFDAVAEMDEYVDVYIVLAPSNPEKHLGLCEAVFPAGKPAFVDKTFAPDLRTAKRIFALADRHGARIQTSSALRYTNVQEAVAAAGRRNLRHMVAWGGGGSFAEYAIHPIELVVSCMGPNATRLARRGSGNHSQLLIDFTGGRTAVINVYVKSNTPFAASLTTREETTYVAVDGSSLFVDAAAGMLDFFDKGRPTIDRKETLTIMKIRDRASSARAMKGFVSLQ